MVLNRHSEQIQIFNDSYERCRKHRDMDDHFVRILLSHPEVAAKFAHISAAQQRRAIISSMLTTMMTITGCETFQDKLSSIADRHGQLGINEHDLDTWEESLLQTVSEIDPYFTTEVHDAWVYVVDSTISQMKQRLHHDDHSPHH